MGKRLIAFTWMLTLFVAATAAANEKFTLVIDAGHGGSDAGAKGAFSKEKTINLKVALAFGRYVEKNLPDVRVIYTRKTDVFVPLHERADIANRNKADLFISIHTNALPKGKIARGMETYTLGMHRVADNLDVAMRENSVILFEDDYKQHYEGFDPNSSESYILFEFMQDRNMEKSVELAQMVQKRACATTGRSDKGVKQAGFLVLRETSMPSCLVELGFITTADEERYLNTDKGVDAFGRGLYLAFADYKRKYGRAASVPYNAAGASGTAATQASSGGSASKAGNGTVSRNEQKKAEEKAREAREKTENTARKAEKARSDEDMKKSAATVAAPTVESITAELADARLAASGSGNVKRQPAANPPPADAKTAVVETTSAVSNSDDDLVAEAGPPVFKVQIMASSRRIDAGDRLFKGLKGVECYSDGGLYKYTYGASTDYNEITRLRKSVTNKFPEAFIVAFKDGRRTDVMAAIREFKERINKD